MFSIFSKHLNGEFGSINIIVAYSQNVVSQATRSRFFFVRFAVQKLIVEKKIYLRNITDSYICLEAYTDCDKIDYETISLDARIDALKHSVSNLFKSYSFFGKKKLPEWVKYCRTTYFLDWMVDR